MERKQIGDESICHQWDLRACILYIMNSCMPKWQMDMEINQISKSEFLKKENCVGVWYLVDTKQHENRCIIHTPTKQTSQLTPKHLQHLCLSSSHACWYWTCTKRGYGNHSQLEYYWPVQHFLHMRTVWPLATPTLPAVTELDRVSWVGSTLVSNSLVPVLLSRLNLSGLAHSWLMQIQPICLF